MVKALAAAPHRRVELDRLAPETRGILECAAVLGREAAWSILAAVTGQPIERLEAELRTLQAVGLLQPTGVPPDRQYRFKHQLTYEVAYGRLLPDRRRALHEAIFRYLEAAPPTPQGDPVTQLAFHAFHGGVWEQALVWCRRAGERAHWRSSNPEASDYFRRARTCLEHLPETPGRLEEAIDVLFGLRWALWPQGRLAEVGAALHEADELAARLGDHRRHGMIAAYLADYLWATGDNARALVAGSRALATAERVQDETLAAQARFGLGLARAALGQYREAADIVATAVGAITGGPSEQGWRVIVMAKGYLARYLAELGDLDEGLAAARSGIEAAESTNDAYSLLGSLLGSGTLHLRRGDLRAAVEVLARGLEIARVRGHVNWVPSLASSLGLSKVLGGEVSDGLELLTDALTAAERSGIPASQPLWMAYSAEGHVVAGRAGVAQSLAETALQVARSRGERGHEAWALRALGNALARLGADDLTSAPEVMRQAATLVEELGMRPLLARCRSDLAGILDRCGRTREAADARAEATVSKAVLGMALADDVAGFYPRS